MEERHTLTDEGIDILSHTRRRDQIHVLTIDPVLATDVCERIVGDARLKSCAVIRPAATRIRDAVEEIEEMARDTVASRLLILDVRRVTLPKLRSVFNTIVGYNRRNFNKLCFTILIGDGPVNLFRAGKALEVFVPHLSSHRVDYHPAVFFYDPFLHYEPDEIVPCGIDEQFVLADVIPRRLVPYFQESESVKVEDIRRYFRAIDKSAEIRKKRRRVLRRLYKKRIAEQFGHHKDHVEDWMSRGGIRIATEKLHLYPLYFEDWVFNLVRKARRNARAARDGKPVPGRGGSGEA